MSFSNIITYINHAYKKQYDDVVEWNLVGRGRHSRDPRVVDNQLRFTESEYKELIDANKEDNLVEVLDAFGDIFVTATYLHFLEPTHMLLSKYYKCLEVANNTLGHSRFVMVIEEVMKSNWTKYPELDDTGIKKELKIFKRKGIDVYTRKHKMSDGRTLVVFKRKEDDKIMKPSSFKGPDIKGLMDSWGEHE